MGQAGAGGGEGKNSQATVSGGGPASGEDAGAGEMG